MTLPAPTYDLVLLLDAQADPAARAKIVDDARKAIADKGEIVNDADWGDRALAYPIDRKKDAEYRLLQFHASSPELLRELDRTLRITDGVVRFRIVKLAPGTPAAPDMRSSSHSHARVSAEAGPPVATPAAADSPAPGDTGATAATGPEAASPAPAQEPAAGEPAEQAALTEQT